MTNYALDNRRQHTLQETYSVHDKIRLRQAYQYPLYVLRDKDDELIFIINNIFYDKDLIKIDKIEGDLYLYDLKLIPKHYMSKLLQIYKDTNGIDFKDNPELQSK